MSTPQQISTEDCCQEFILKEVDLISSNTSASNDGQASVEFGRLISWPASGMSNASETCEFPEKVIVLSGPRVHLFAFKEDEDGGILDKHHVSSKRISQTSICEEAAFSPDGRYIIVGDSEGMVHCLTAENEVELLLSYPLLKGDKLRKNDSGRAFCAVAFTAVPPLCEALPDILLCSGNGDLYRLGNIDLERIEQAASKKDLLELKRQITKTLFSVKENIDQTVISFDQYWTASYTLAVAGSVGSEHVADIYKLPNTADTSVEHVQHISKKFLQVEGVKKVKLDHFAQMLGLLSTDGKFFLFQCIGNNFQHLEARNKSLHSLLDFEFIPPDDVDKLQKTNVGSGLDEAYLSIISDDSSKIVVEKLQISGGQFSSETVASLSADMLQSISAPSSGLAHVFMLQRTETGALLSLLMPTPAVQQLENLIASNKIDEATKLAEENDLDPLDVTRAEASVLSTRISASSDNGAQEEENVKYLAAVLDKLNAEESDDLDDDADFIARTCLRTYCTNADNQEKLLKYALGVCGPVSDGRGEDPILLGDLPEIAIDTISCKQEAYQMVFFALEKWRLWTGSFQGSFSWENFLDKNLSEILQLCESVNALCHVWQHLPYPTTAALIVEHLTRMKVDLLPAEIDTLCELLTPSLVRCLSEKLTFRLAMWGTSLTEKLVNAERRVNDALIVMTFCLKGGLSALETYLGPCFNKICNKEEVDMLRFLRLSREYEWVHTSRTNDKHNVDNLISEFCADPAKRMGQNAVMLKTNSSVDFFQIGSHEASVSSILSESPEEAKEHWLKLMELVVLSTQHSLYFTLEEFNNMSLDALGVAVLDNCTDPAYLGRHIKEQVVPFCWRHHMKVDSLLASYITELCEVYEPGDDELEERINILIRSISTPSISAETTTEFLKVCRAPYAQRCYQLVEDIKKWIPASVEAMIQQERLMVIQDILYEYNITDVNLSDDVQAWSACCQMISVDTCCRSLFYSLAFCGMYSSLTASALHTSFLECVVCSEITGREGENCHKVYKKNRELALQVALVYPLVLKRFMDLRKRQSFTPEQICTTLHEKFTDYFQVSLGKGISCLLGDGAFESWMERFSLPVNPRNGHTDTDNCLDKMILNSSLLSCLEEIDSENLLRTGEETLKFCVDRVDSFSSDQLSVEREIIASVTEGAHNPAESDRCYIDLNESIITLSTACIDLNDSKANQESFSRLIEVAQRNISLCSEFGIRPSFQLMSDDHVQRGILNAALKKLSTRKENRYCDRILEFALCHQQAGRFKRIISLFNLPTSSVVADFCAHLRGNEIVTFPYVHTVACLDNVINKSYEDGQNRTAVDQLIEISRGICLNSNNSTQRCEDLVPVAATEVSKLTLTGCSDEDLCSSFENWQQLETSEWVWRSSDVGESMNNKGLSSNEPSGSVMSLWRGTLREIDQPARSNTFSSKIFGSNDTTSAAEDLFPHEDIPRMFKSHFSDTNMLLTKQVALNIVKWLNGCLGRYVEDHEVISTLLNQHVRQLALRIMMVKQYPSSMNSDLAKIFSLLSSAVLDSGMNDADLCSAYLLQGSDEDAISSLRNLIPAVICKPSSLSAVAEVGHRLGVAFSDSALQQTCEQLRQHCFWVKDMQKAGVNVVSLDSSSSLSALSPLEVMEEWGKKNFISLLNSHCTEKRVVLYCKCYNIPLELAFARIIELMLIDVRCDSCFSLQWQEFLRQLVSRIEAGFCGKLLKNCLQAINPYDYERILFVTNTLHRLLPDERQVLHQVTLIMKNYRRRNRPAVEEICDPQWSTNISQQFDCAQVLPWNPRDLLRDAKCHERLPVHSLLSHDASDLLSKELSPATLPQLLPLTLPLALHEDFFHEQLCKSMAKKYIVHHLCNCASVLSKQFKEVCLDNVAKYICGNEAHDNRLQIKVYLSSSTVDKGSSDDAQQCIVGIGKCCATLNDYMHKQFERLQFRVLNELGCCSGSDDDAEVVRLEDLQEQLEQITDFEKKMQTLQWVHDAIPLDKKQLESQWGGILATFSSELEVCCEVHSDSHKVGFYSSVSGLMSAELTKHLKETLNGVEHLFDLPELSFMPKEHSGDFVYDVPPENPDFHIDVCFYNPQARFVDKICQVYREESLSWNSFLENPTESEIDANPDYLGKLYQPLLRVAETSGFVAAKLVFLSMQYELSSINEFESKENQTEQGGKSMPSTPSKLVTKMRNMLLRLKFLRVGAMKYAGDVPLNTAVNGEDVLCKLLNDTSHHALHGFLKSGVDQSLNIECDEEFRSDKTPIALKLFALCEDISKQSSTSLSQVRALLIHRWLKEEPKHISELDENGQLPSLLSPCETERDISHIQCNVSKIVYLLLVTNALKHFGKEKTDSLGGVSTATETLINHSLSSSPKLSQFEKYMAVNVVAELAKLSSDARSVCLAHLQGFREACGNEADELIRRSLCNEPMTLRLSPIVAYRDLLWFMYECQRVGIEQDIASVVSNSKLSFAKGIWKQRQRHPSVPQLVSRFVAHFSLPLTTIINETYAVMIKNNEFRSAIFLAEKIVNNFQHRALIENDTGFAESTVRLAESCAKVLEEFQRGIYQIKVPVEFPKVISTQNLCFTDYSACSNRTVRLLDSINWFFSKICFVLRTTELKLSKEQLQRTINAFRTCEPMLTPQLVFLSSLGDKKEISTSLNTRTAGSMDFLQLQRFLSVAYPRSFESVESWCDINELLGENAIYFSRSSCWPVYLLCMAHYGKANQVLRFLSSRAYWHSVIHGVSLIVNHFGMPPDAGEKMSRIQECANNGSADPVQWESGNEPIPTQCLQAMPEQIQLLAVWADKVDTNMWNDVNVFLHQIWQKLKQSKEISAHTTE